MLVGTLGVTAVTVVTAAGPASAAVGGDPSAEAVALAKAASTGQRVEVTEDDSETETVYANPDGTLTSEVSQVPVRVPDADGDLVPVNLDLHTDDGRLAPKASDADVSFSADGDGTLAALDTAGAGSFGLGIDEDLSSPTVSDGAASYPVAGSDPTTVSVAANSAGFSAHVVLPSAPTTAPVYSFPLTLNGLTASLVTDGDAGQQLVLKNAGGDVVAESAPLVMWDAAKDAGGDPANEVPVDAALVDAPGGGTALQLSPSMDYLTAASTQYPVTVDPDITVPAVSRRGDSYISSTNTTTVYSTDYRVRVGSSDGTTSFRGFETFNIDKYLGYDVKSATLAMYQYYSASCTPQTTNTYPTSATPNSSGVTWANQPAADTSALWSSSNTSDAGGSGTGCTPNATQNINVTKILNEYVSGENDSSVLDDDGSGDDNQRHIATIELRSAHEQMATSEARFCSMNYTNGAGTQCSTAATTPQLSITYAPQVGLESSYSTTNHKLNTATSLAVNNDSGNAIVKAKDLHITGIGEDLSLTRWYNSQASEDATSLGTSGWSFSAGPDVYLEKLSGYRYDYHSPDGHIYGAYVRKSSNSGDTANYDQFYEPKYGGGNAFLVDNGDGTFTLTFHSSQTKYVFKAIGSSGNLYLSKILDRTSDNTDNIAHPAQENQIVFTYGSGSQLSSITDTAGRTISFTYNTAGDISVITDSNGPVTRTWQYGYDSHRNLTSYIDPAGAETDYEYTQTGSVDGTAWGLDKITNPAQTSGPNTGKRPTTLIGYTAGQATSVKYQNGTSGGSPTYDASSWVYSSTPDSSCHFNNGQTDLQSADRSTAVTDSNSHTTTYCFADRKTSMNQSVDVIDAAGHHRGDTFSPDQQPSTITSPEDDQVMNGSTTASYGAGSGGAADQLSNVTEPRDNSTDSSGATATMKYEASSSIPGYRYLPTSKLGSNLRCTAYTYEGTGSKGTGQVQDAYIGLDPTGVACSGQTGANHWHNDYNSNGTIADTYDANGSATAADETVYTYWASGDSGIAAHGVGELKSVQRPGGSCSGTIKLCTSYTYDGDGRIATKTDGRAEKTTYTYDKDDRTIQVLFHGASTCVLSSGNCLQYSYDGEGNQTSRTDGTGTSTFTYDLLNQQTQQSTPDGTVIGTVYDGEANLTSYTQTVPNVGASGSTSDTVSYTYNAADQVTKVHDSTGDINISENKDGKPNNIAFPTTSHALSVAYNYFNSGKTKSINVTDAGNSNLPSYSYSYTNGTIETDQLQSATTSTSAGTNGLDGTISYTYGPADRLASLTDSSTAGSAYSYNYDNAGQMTSATKGSTNTYYGYDENGDLCWKGPNNGTNVAQGCPTMPGGDTAVTHDNAGENTGTSGSTNTYDPDQRASSLSGVSQSYLDQGNDLRAGSGSGSTAIVYANGALGVTARATTAGTTFYTRDPHGNLLDEHGAGGTDYYLSNYQRSVMALVSADGNYLNGSYLYSPYGDTTVNARSGGSAAANNPWQYAGGYHDTLEGDNYYHFGARYYAPSNGRWTQPDPKPGNINNPSSLLTYGYAGDDPVDGSDPAGTDTLDNVLSGIATVASAVAFGADLAGQPEVGLAAGAVGAVSDAAKTAHDCVGGGDGSCGEAAGGLALDASTLGAGKAFGEGASAIGDAATLNYNVDGYLE